MIKYPEQLRQFRNTVYQSFGKSRDAAFEVIDAIASSPDARSAVGVSESPLMKRKFSSVYKALERVRLDRAKRCQLLTKQSDEAGTLLLFVNGARHALYALDHTPYPRRHAPTVCDCGFVHGANGREIGHQYSLLMRVMHPIGAWMGVIDVMRIPSDRTAVKVRAEQLTRLWQNTRHKSIISADSEYFTRDFLALASDHILLLVRMASHRVLYGAPPKRRPGQKGPNPKHGCKLTLNDYERFGEPTLRYTIQEPDGSSVEILALANMHTEDNPTVVGHAILVRVLRCKGEPRYRRPLWLFWTGPLDVDWATFWRIYLKRYCCESVHQFGKNNLAWTRARLSYTEREEVWTWLVMLAYWQLLLSAPIAQDCFRPWQKPMPAGRMPTPYRVQRDYFRIIAIVGTPASPPKPRGIATGRPFGYRPKPRPRYCVVLKAKNTS